jgi:hypothetical protein
MVTLACALVISGCRDADDLARLAPQMLAGGSLRVPPHKTVPR